MDTLRQMGCLHVLDVYVRSLPAAEAAAPQVAEVRFEAAWRAGQGGTSHLTQFAPVPHHGCQGESLVPPYTRRSVSFSLSVPSHVLHLTSPLTSHRYLPGPSSGQWDLPPVDASAEAASAAAAATACSSSSLGGGGGGSSSGFHRGLHASLAALRAGDPKAGAYTRAVFSST
jgi:hypothetical protein